MQNHLEISSKSKFWTRNVRNLSKSLTESLRKVYGIYGIFQDLFRKTHKGPYGPQPGPGEVKKQKQFEKINRENSYLTEKTVWKILIRCVKKVKI